MQGELQLTLLGKVDISRDGEPIAGFSTNKDRALLIYLAVTGRPHARPTLAGLLWGNMPEANARTNLRRSLSTLRRLVGPHLDIGRQTVAFDRHAPFWIDVEAFEAHALSGDDVGRLQEAVELYRGDFLEGFFLRGAPAFEEWAVAQGARLRELALQALYTLSVHYAGLGQAGLKEGIDYTTRLLALEPWREEAHQGLMRLLAGSGQRGAALAQYEACRRALAEELGVEPGPETKELYERIRDGELAAGPPIVPRRTRYNLPVQATPFIGRAAELAEIVGLLRDPACRLVTLVGPGGSGKTRLALKAAEARLDDFEHGVFFVSLAPLESADAIVPTVADVLGFQFYGGRTPQQQLLDYLSQKNLLLIMDNYEHLIACPEPGRGNGVGLVADIIETAPEVQILATSRARLNVGGEHRFQVEGMDYPESTLEKAVEATRYSAVELFTQSARRARSDFQLADDNLSGVLAVCRLAEGMPLAIRLAAAWVTVLTPAEIANEIGQNIDVLATERRDAPERQRSMRAAFEHSWTMLTKRERKVMQALSIFRGGFTRKAARQVSGASLAELLALVNKSLVRRTSGGYFEVHELLRQYAAEELDQTPSAAEAARDRHAAFYATALHGWGNDLKGPQQLTTIAQMDAEIENARAAWDWAAERGQADQLDQAMEGLLLFYEWRARYFEGETACRVAEKALAAGQTADAPGLPTPGERDPKGPLTPPDHLRLRAGILTWHGWFERHMGRIETARELLESSLSLLDASELDGRDIRKERAIALRRLGFVTGHAGDAEDARRILGESVALCRAMGDRRETAYALFRLGSIACTRSGDYDLAGKAFEESLGIVQELGDRRGLSTALGCLSTLELSRWQLEQAERLARHCIDLRREMGYRNLLSRGLARLGWIHYLCGAFSKAQSVLDETLSTAKDWGIRRDLPYTYALLGLVRLEMGEYGAAHDLAQLGLEEAREIGLPRLEALPLPGQDVLPQEVLGRHALVVETYEDAEQLLGECAVYFREIGIRQRIGENLALWAMASMNLDRIPQARARVVEGLGVALETRSVPSALIALCAESLLLTRRAGSASRDVERAVELYALVSRYPLVANSRWFEDVVGKPITAAAAILPPGVVEAAQERVRARDLWDTVTELLVELEG